MEPPTEIVKRFVARYGARFRYLHRQWWVLEDDGYWAQAASRTLILAGVRQIIQELPQEQRWQWWRDHAASSYHINRVTAALGLELAAWHLPGREEHPHQPVAPSNGPG